jgi:hypothetical protein
MSKAALRCLLTTIAMLCDVSQLACSYLACSAYISKPGDWSNVKENVQDKALEAWSNDLKVRH